MKDLPLNPPMISTSACSLCALEIKSAPVKDFIAGEELYFCCPGCLRVYHILYNSGVLNDPSFRESPLYQRCLQLGVIARPEAYETESRGEPACSPSDEGQTRGFAPTTHQQKITLELSGLWCPSCAWLIERVLRAQAGVISTRINFAADNAEIIFDPLKISAPQVQKVIQDLGYGAHLPEEAESAGKKEARELLLRLGVAWAFSLNVMMLSMVLYIGYFQELTGESRRLFPYLTAVLTLPVIFYSAAPLWRRAFYSLYYRAPTMELLIALSVFSSFAYSLYEMWRGSIKVYFEVSAMIVALVLLGKYLEALARQRTEKSIAALAKVLPKKFRASTEEVWKRVEELKEGERFWVKAGEKIPADGKIIEGRGLVDEALLSGESKPLEKSPGQVIRAGSILMQGNLTAAALSRADNFTLTQITSLVSAARNQKTPRERLVDRLSYYFIILVAAGALTNFILLLIWQKPLEAAILRSIALLVIACPCALGIATPLAVAATVNRALHYGILVKNAEALERAKDIDTVILDKTGTLTCGTFKIQNINLFSSGANSFSAEKILSYAASVEACSGHPLAAAFQETANQSEKVGTWRAMPLLKTEHYQEIPGVGVEGIVEGKKIKVGNKKIIEKNVGADPCVRPEFEGRHAGLPLQYEIINQAETESKTILFMTIDDKLTASFELGDEVRPETAAVIQALHAQGKKVLIASGDSAAATEAVASGIGADGFRAPLSHEEKVEWILSLQQEGAKVAMVGDGVNDGPALAAADLGIAVSSGTDLAKEAADLTLLDRNISALPKALELSRKTDKIIKQNLTWAFFYNLLGLGLAAAGILSPLWAAAAMLLSSLSVVGNSLRVAKL